MSATLQATASQYLSFLIAGEENALPLLSVKEIVEYETLTIVPGAPAWIRGVINLRGRAVPVIDLAVKFGLPPFDPGRRSCIVIVEIAVEGIPTTFGLLSEAVCQVLELMPDQIEPPPTFGTRIHLDHITGMAGVGRRFVLLLKLDRLLEEAEVHQVGELAEQTGVEATAAAAE
jgi:purine-binding chemotaxis protein CheW